jgi:hypothetical protein
MNERYNAGVVGSDKPIRVVSPKIQVTFAVGVDRPTLLVTCGSNGRAGENAHEIT